jgi:hypothetical protein
VSMVWHASVLVARPRSPRHVIDRGPHSCRWVAGNVRSCRPATSASTTKASSRPSPPPISARCYEAPDTRPLFHRPLSSSADSSLGFQETQYRGVGGNRTRDEGFAVLRVTFIGVRQRPPPDDRMPADEGERQRKATEWLLPMWPLIQKIACSTSASIVRASSRAVSIRPLSIELVG